MVQESFFDQPYIDRQLVLFIEDKALAASGKMTRKAIRLLHRLVQRLTGAFNALGLLGRLATAPLVFIDILFSYREAKEEGVESLNLVGKSKVRFFQLPPGHPRNRVVYAGHPGIPALYVPLADFHRLTFEHKFGEVVSLLMHLGAKTLKVEHVTGWGIGFSSHLSLNFPPGATSGINVGANFDSNQQTARSVLFEAEFNNQQTPSLPPNLVWYPFEATWQQVTDGRLGFGMKHFSLTLNYRDDYGLNAGLKLKLEKAGLDLGGTFEKLVETTWTLSGDF